MLTTTEQTALDALAAAAAEVAGADSLRSGLDALARAAAVATGVDLVVVRSLDGDGRLAVRATAPHGWALAPVVAGTRTPAATLERAQPSDSVARAAASAAAQGVLAVPALASGRVVGSVELIRIEGEITERDRAVAELVGAQVALAVRTLAPDTGAAAVGRRARWLELAGEALASGGDMRRSAQQAVRVAVEATGARGGALWQLGSNGELSLLTATVPIAQSRGPAQLVHDTIGLSHGVSITAAASLPADATYAATIALGRPPFAALQLFLTGDPAGTEQDLPALTAFAARAAHALRTGERARGLSEELERVRALYEVVGEAVSRLSLTHTLETAIERVEELLGVDGVGVYLSDGREFTLAAGRGLPPGHEDVAAHLLGALLGPMRARAAVHVTAHGSRSAVRAVRTALTGAGRDSVIAAPLVGLGETIGLLVAYPGARLLSETDAALLTSLCAPLAIAVQNARLHEQTQELSERLRSVLVVEREASRQEAAVHAISRSFAHSLSLENTLTAVTETIVDVLGLDAAVIRTPDERGEQFVTRSMHVAEVRFAAAVRAILQHPQPTPPRRTEPVMLDAGLARRSGGAHALLAPFLDKGSTAADLPVATPTELLAQLTIVSLDPGRPITRDALATAATIAQQAALAIDNARLYQQQNRFAETMQRSLLPNTRPSIEGLSVGAVYESAAQLDVGGDVFDFLELPDGRLAVVLGDVTGHGVDATADMALAKYVFRSLAREHPNPADFLARANDVVVSELADGKFISMVALTVSSHGETRCASAGHPPPLLVSADGTVATVPCAGLALGIEDGQFYDQGVVHLTPGASIVLYTDGVVESRSGSDIFGSDRLEAVLSSHAGRSAQALAEAVVSAARDFAAGVLPDDCAVVVIKKS